MAFRTQTAVGLALCASLLLALTITIIISGLRLQANTDEQGANSPLFVPVFNLGTNLIAEQRDDDSCCYSASYTLPGDAKQGGTGWYALDAVVRIRLSASATPGSVSYANILTNGFAVGKIKVTPEGSHFLPAFRWGTYELFDGPSSGVVSGRSITLNFRNYLQSNGVTPHTNTLSIQLEQYGAPVVTSATLLPGSAIVFGKLGPPALRFEASPSAVKLRVGQMVDVNYELFSKGFPGRGMSLSFDPSSPGLSPISPPKRLLGWVSDIRGDAGFIALTPGDYVITVSARSKAGKILTVKIPIRVDEALGTSNSILANT